MTRGAEPCRNFRRIYGRPEPAECTKDTEQVGQGIDLSSDAAYLKILGSEFTSVTPGNGMKWYATEPQQGVFDWTKGGQIVNFARRQAIRDALSA
jgi:GH35 family endo-1,4-beta-xylanase